MIDQKIKYENSLNAENATQTEKCESKCFTIKGKTFSYDSKSHCS